MTFHTLHCSLNILHLTVHVECDCKVNTNYYFTIVIITKSDTSASSGYSPNPFGSEFPEWYLRSWSFSLPQLLWRLHITKKSDYFETMSSKYWLVIDWKMVTVVRCIDKFLRMKFSFQNNLYNSRNLYPKLYY